MNDYNNVLVGFSELIKNEEFRPYEGDLRLGVDLGTANIVETSIGRKAPLTPWGKKALGVKTRNSKKHSNRLIVRRRNAK